MYYIEKYQLCGKKRCKKCYGTQVPRGHGPYIWRVTYRRLAKRGDKGREHYELMGPATKFRYLLSPGKTRISTEVSQ